MCDCLSGCQTVSVSLSLIYRCAYSSGTSFRSCDVCGDVCCTATHSDSTRSPACCRAAAVAMFRSTCASASLASRFASRGMLMWQWLACEWSSRSSRHAGFSTSVVSRVATPSPIPRSVVAAPVLPKVNVGSWFPFAYAPSTASEGCAETLEMLGRNSRHPKKVRGL